MTEKGRKDWELWRDNKYQPPLSDGYFFDSMETVCHSFVNNGRIQFLLDCTHHLAGQTVNLPPFNEEDF